jgi:hypothetical protein
MTGPCTWPARTSASRKVLGGPYGYIDFLGAMHNPGHEQQADYWRCWGGPFDPQAFSTNAANLAIRKLSVSHAHVKTVRRTVKTPSGSVDR